MDPAAGFPPESHVESPSDEWRMQPRACRRPPAAVQSPMPPPLCPRDRYLADTYQLKAEATVCGIMPAPDNGSPMIALDRTIFHPQGGGQPTDKGVMRAASGAEFAVSMVRHGEGGVVSHAGSYATDSAFAVGDRVTLHVDGEWRLQSARLHSAGHLIDAAMRTSQYASLKAGKGCVRCEGKPPRPSRASRTSRNAG